jgi:hypothetical protein
LSLPFVPFLFPVPSARTQGPIFHPVFCATGLIYPQVPGPGTGALSVHPFLPPLPTKPVSSHPSVYHTFISVCFRGHVPFSTPPGVTCHARESNWLCHHSNLGLNPASAISQHVIFIPPSQGTHCDHV